jgi:hypothetical protein
MPRCHPRLFVHLNDRVCVKTRFVEIVGVYARVKVDEGYNSNKCQNNGAKICTCSAERQQGHLDRLGGETILLADEIDNPID